MFKTSIEMYSEVAVVLNNLNPPKTAWQQVFDSISIAS